MFMFGHLCAWGRRLLVVLPIIGVPLFSLHAQSQKQVWWIFASNETRAVCGPYLNSDNNPSSPADLIKSMQSPAAKVSFSILRRDSAGHPLIVTVSITTILAPTMPLTITFVRGATFCEKIAREKTKQLEHAQEEKQNQLNQQLSGLGDN